MQDSMDSYDDNNPIIESEPELDVNVDDMKSDDVIVPNSDYVIEVRKLVNVDEKQWNIHTLRGCTKHLTNMTKKDFKKQRYIATISNNFKLEKKILEQMLCNKASNLSSEEFAVFYKKLHAFTTKRLLHPRKKYMDY